LLLERATLIPAAGDGALKIIVQAEIPAALMLRGVQVNPLTVGCVAPPPPPPTKIVSPVLEERVAEPVDVDATVATGIGREDVEEFGETVNVATARTPLLIID